MGYDQARATEDYKCLQGWGWRGLGAAVHWQAVAGEGGSGWLKLPAEPGPAHTALLQPPQGQRAPATVMAKYTWTHNQAGRGCEGLYAAFSEPKFIELICT